MEEKDNGPSPMVWFLVGGVLVALGAAAFLLLARAPAPGPPPPAPGPPPPGLASPRPAPPEPRLVGTVRQPDGSWLVSFEVCMDRPLRDYAGVALKNVEAGLGGPTWNYDVAYDNPPLPGSRPDLAIVAICLGPLPADMKDVGLRFDVEGRWSGPTGSGVYVKSWRGTVELKENGTAPK